ncbi:unnamed protein product [Pleuronectes platessa]|uniref:Uncharacterized protein n=1 Tax=Pleuronectes platessa TaxID=8262 RepID=A0A9N7U6L0_PLEPL|nr:unnamed protein product [Pleuronectes platessa]
MEKKCEQLRSEGRQQPVCQYVLEQILNIHPYLSCRSQGPFFFYRHCLSVILSLKRSIVQPTTSLRIQQAPSSTCWFHSTTACVGFSLRNAAYLLPSRAHAYRKCITSWTLSVAPEGKIAALHHPKKQ